jgi:phosphoadenosine phosphosulfate reductase
MQDIINKYNLQFREAGPEEILGYFLEQYKGKIAFSTSLGAEDQVLTHMIAGLDPAVKIFTLDTGRLFQETYDLLAITEGKYRIRIGVMFPDARRVEKMVRERGINLFYESMENRKLCCYTRKVDPLKRGLAGMEAWITGLRRTQSQSRQDIDVAEWDAMYNIIKINPLASFTRGQVWDYIREHHIPYNTLHDKGFASIGCLPCTRAILPGEDERAGRWWWEQQESSECGIHSGD